MCERNFEAGQEIWVVEREFGEAFEVSGVMFLATSVGCVIATAFIDDYDLEETITYHINETSDNIDTDLKVYPIEDCYYTKEEAEKALQEEQE
jgi:hypothetical protein